MELELLPKHTNAIQLPLSTDPLAHLLHSLREAMEHNFSPCILTIAGTRNKCVFSVGLEIFLYFSGAVMSLQTPSRKVEVHKLGKVFLT